MFGKQVLFVIRQVIRQAYPPEEVRHFGGNRALEATQHFDATLQYFITHMHIPHMSRRERETVEQISYSLIINFEHRCEQYLATGNQMSADCAEKCVDLLTEFHDMIFGSMHNSRRSTCPTAEGLRKELPYSVF